MRIELLFKYLIFLLTALGIYSGLLFAETLTPQLCRSKVNAAAKLLETRGTVAISRIKDRYGEFRFGEGDGYIWIHNLEGRMIMHPTKPNLNGKDIMGISDSQGTYIFVAMNKIARKHKAGWVFYYGVNPEKRKIIPQASYIKLAKYRQKTYVLGTEISGIAAEEIKSQFPEDAFYGP